MLGLDLKLIENNLKFRFKIIGAPISSNGKNLGLVFTRSAVCEKLTNQFN